MHQCDMKEFRISKQGRFKGIRMSALEYSASGNKINFMAYIDLKNDLPGIRGLMAYRPETAKPLNELAEILLRDDNNTLTRGEREMIGAYVS